MFICEMMDIIEDNGMEKHFNQCQIISFYSDIIAELMRTFFDDMTVPIIDFNQVLQQIICKHATATIWR